MSSDSTVGHVDGGAPVCPRLTPYPPLNVFFHPGTDKADWRKYEEHDPLGKHSAYGDETTLAQKKHEAVTQAEFEEQMGEMHQQLMHTEKMLSQMSETRDRTEKARGAVIGKLMGDNTTVSGLAYLSMPSGREVGGCIKQMSNNTTVRGLAYLSLSSGRVSG